MEAHASSPLQELLLRFPREFQPGEQAVFDRALYYVVRMAHSISHRVAQDPLWN